MGSGNFDVVAYKKQAEEAKVKVNSGFTADSMCDEFNPAIVTTRHSKKGPFNEYRDVITVLIGLDVTGSMDIIPKSLLEGSLGSLMVDLKKTFGRPNENLQISFAGIGDAESDRAPLQVTHFESDNRFAQQLEKIWLEGGGGANGAESYNLLWWYAANKTHLNYVQQDGRKGILITIGDDNVHPGLTAAGIQMWLDPKYDGGDISNQVLLHAVREQYDVYHIVITDGQAYWYDLVKKANKTAEQKLTEAKQWTDLLGMNNVICTKSNGVADAIAEIIKRTRPIQKVGLENLTEAEWSRQNKENLTDQQWAEVLSYTLCPLTRQYMDHPVDWGGHKRAYERQAVENYVRDNLRDPVTQRATTLRDLMLKPNLNIAQLCLSYKPFFDALPADRRERLVQMAFPAPVPAVERKKSIDRGPVAFFAPGGSEHAQQSIDKMHKDLECPISHEIMEDPVILVETGQSFERREIVKWLASHNTCPFSHVELSDKTIAPNIALRRLCDEARAGAQLH